MYLSNFGRMATSISSVNTGCDNNNVSEADFALSKALAEEEVSDNKARIKTLQSKISRIYSSLSNSSRISGVNPLFRACSLASCMMSSKLLRFATNRAIVSDKAFFSIGDIRSNFSATGSLTSKVIVFMTCNSDNKYNEIWRAV